MTEMEFVGAFLKGLRETKQRDVLVKELQKAHQCCTGKDGRVEIICEWEDVAEALVKAGLVESEGRVGKPGKRRKRILIPKEMIENETMM
jgi:hypothetical protein